MQLCTSLCDKALEGCIGQLSPLHRCPALGPHLAADDIFGDAHIVIGSRRVRRIFKEAHLMGHRLGSTHTFTYLYGE